MKRFILAVAVLLVCSQAEAGGFAIAPRLGFVITKQYSQPQQSVLQRIPPAQPQSPCADGKCGISQRTTLWQKIRGF